MKNLLSILLILTSLGIFTARIVKKVTFEQNVKGLLKRAADANSIDLANKELTKALDYLEANDLTSGYTSIFWKTPDEDIEFWYTNLKASQHELETLNSKSALEKTNVLMKLRETLLDEGESTKVTYPEGMAVYPQNKLWAALILIALISGFIGIMIPIAEADKRAKAKVVAETKE